MWTSHVDVAVMAPPEYVQVAVQEAFVANGLSPRWWSATEGRAVGALCSFEFEILTAPGCTILRLHKRIPGLAFGLGESTVRFKQITNWVCARFQAQGLLIGVSGR